MPIPRVIANLTVTLDGHSTGPDGPYDMSCIAPHGVSEQARDALVRMTDATVVLLGRVNYEGFGHYWPSVADNPEAEPRDRRFSSWLTEVEKIVFSSTLIGPLPWKNARIADVDPVRTVRRLRTSEVGDIRVLSSQSIIRALLAANEVDILELTIAPEVAGGGALPFPEKGPRSHWLLEEVQPTDTGAVRLVYRSTKNA